MKCPRKALCAVSVAVGLIAATVILIQAFNSAPRELTLQDQAVSFITYVAGIDLSKCNVSITMNQPYEFDGVIRESLRLIWNQMETPMT
ncbi:MAG: hypothetical protein NWE94_07975 [Candidatus Bathyarchaeota archaeon]|nr:hypothetical protein [Candidatus Bathyarchaeota archaeon]